MNKVITIGGTGERMKGLSYKDKYNLYYGKKRILDWILEIFPDALLLGFEKTNNRLETLNKSKFRKDLLIIDCDIIPFGINKDLNLKEDTIWYFESNKDKYSSLIIEDNILIDSKENLNISKYKSSGLYFAKDLEFLLEKMKNNKNSIAEAMIGSRAIKEDSFLRFGDVEDYYESIKVKRTYDNNL